MPLGEYVPTADQRIVIGGVSWGAFEALLAARGERSAPRMAFLDGVVEIMGPSRDHEGIKSMIACLIEAYCLDRGVVLAPYGSWLLSAERERAGVEPDECYVFGPDPKSKARPDLAIEVVWTSGGIDKLEAYRRLGVAEVWFWIDDAISVHVLVGEHYEGRTRSACLPELDLALIARLCALDTLNDAIAQLRASR